MIQRIQTLYLLLVVLSMTLLGFFSPVEFMTPTSEEIQQRYMMHFFSIDNITNPEVTQSVLSVWALSALHVCSAVIALVSIFLYKKRIIQARINVINIFLLLGYYLVLGVYIFFACKQLHVDWYISTWAALPLVGIVLTFMAIRAILKDEAMVRAADRIR